MIRNGREIANGSEVTAQVCVVGTGPAGVTAAWYLQQAGIDVVLLEGSRDLEAQCLNENQWLYRGKSSGQLGTNEPEFLSLPERYGVDSPPSERERAFGGTSVHWGGQSRPLNPVAFKARANFPAWPIDREDLDPYYAEYCKLMSLYGDYYGPGGEAGHNFTAEFWAGELGQEVASLEGFEVSMYQFPMEALIRFATRKFGRAMDGSGGTSIGDSQARVIRNASLLEIVHEGGSVSELKVASINSNLQDPQRETTFAVKADAFVLACGAVANARQLLLSKLGNSSDQVGRYFMGQPWSKGRQVHVDPNSYLDAAQIALLGYQRVPSSKYGIQQVVGKFEPTAEELDAHGVGGCWFNAGGSIVYYETAPDPNNRITLATTKDPVFGQAQSHITWSPTSVDESTYNVLTQRYVDSVAAVAKTLGRSRTSARQSAVVPKWSEIVPDLIVNGHHTGTTRMSDDAKDGVVDANLKLHEADNFYVAGSSVFPSAGLSNPTMTIVALSIRLAEHLKKTLGPTAPS